MESRRGKVWVFVDRATVVIFGAVVPASLIFMTAMLTAGVWELAEAILKFDWPWKNMAPSGAESSIGSTILALEMFILAPLPYLVLEGMALHVTKHSNDEDHIRAKADASLPKTKAIVASILVSTVAVHIVGSVLNGDALTWETAATELLIIVVLTGYYVLMEKTAKAKDTHATRLENDLNLDG